MVGTAYEQWSSPMARKLNRLVGSIQSGMLKLIHCEPSLATWREIDHLEIDDWRQVDHDSGRKIPKLQNANYVSTCPSTDYHFAIKEG